MKAIYYTHLVSVILFLLLYLVKTSLLLANKDESLARVTKITRVPEMIISTLFLVTGVYMLTQMPEIKSFLIIKIIAVLASIPLAVVGFKKKKKALAVIAMLLLVAAYGLAEMSKKQGLKSKNDSASSADGKQVDGHNIFVANCASCHGEDGKLGLMGSTDLSVSALPLEDRINVIKNGRGRMTAFGEVLTDEEIRAVAEYSETLKK